MPRVITLTTDFGHGSTYPAQMKGVNLSRKQAVAMVDLTHAITNCTSDDLGRVGASGAMRVTCRDRTVDEAVTKNGRSDAGTLVALVGSSGRLELAVVNGHAGKLLGAQTGDEVTIRFSAI